MSKGRRRRRGNRLSFGTILLLLILFNIFKESITTFLILAVILAALVTLIVALLSVRDKRRSADGKKTDRSPVDVSTHGTYQRTANSGNSASARAAAGQTNARPAEQPRPAAQTPAERPVSPKSQAKPQLSPEVQAVVDEGERAHRELEHLYATIPDLAVKAKIRELIDVSDKITADAVDDPSDVPQIKKFQDYYLPTTIKLLNAYDRMGAQGIQGENISGTMDRISEMLDTAIEAYKRLLDNLFADQALDVETDIQVMNTLLQREGLSGGGAGFGK